jgi:bisanhydrobacterioruberin hydratase
MSSNLQSILPSFSLPRQSLKWSLFVTLLVHVSGAIGMTFFNREFFVGFTAVNLLLMFILLLWNETELRFTYLKAILFAFVAGLFAEIIGVNTGILFGDYHYSKIFGEKLMGVPILIGLNWFCIVYASFQVVLKFIKLAHLNGFAIAFLTAFLATLFDFVMEPVAIELGFWQWHTPEIPFLNYACWFIISFLIALFFHWIGVKKNNPFAVYLFFIQLLFFVFLALAIS